MGVNLKNWKTTLFGALAAALTIAGQIPGLEGFTGVFTAAAGLFGAIGLYFAKDASTGSTPPPG